MDDAWEVANQLDPTDPKDAWCDYDNDQILNLFEYQLQTDPCAFASPPIRYFTPQNTQDEFTGLMNSGIGDLAVIRMSAGTYNLFYNLNSSGGAMASSDYKIMIQGGWNSDFTEYNPFEYSTILNGQDSSNILVLETHENRQVAFIMDGIEVTNSGNGIREGAIECIDQAGTGKFSFYNCSFYNNGYSSNLSFNNGMALAIFWTQEMINGEFFLVNSSIVNNRNGLYGRLYSRTTGRWRIINSTLAVTQNTVLEVEGTSQIPQAISIDVVNSILWEDNINYPIQFPRALNTQLNITNSNTDEINNSDNRLDVNIENRTAFVPQFIDATLNHFELEAESPLKERGLDVGLPFDGALPDLGVNQKVHSQIRIDTLITPPNCLGYGGSIEIVSLDGLSNLNFSLNNVDYQTDNVFNNLVAGSYILYVNSEETCQKLKLPFVLEAAEELQEATATFCAGNEYILPDGMTATEAGLYNSLITNNQNCEVLIQTTLTELPPFEEEILVEICEGNTYELPDGEIVSEEGIYTTQFLTVEGCDSTIITNLTITTTPQNILPVTICEGEFYLLQDGTSVSQAGQYVYSVVNEQGCVEVVGIDLVVNDKYETTESIIICEGQTHILPDGREVTMADVYESIFQSSNGCDSIIITNLSFQLSPLIEAEVSICEGGTYVLEDGTAVNEAGVYTFDLTDAATGCITTYQTTVKIDDAYVTTEDIAICEGQTYILPDGREVGTADTYASNLQSLQGCDSIIVTNLSTEVSPSIEYEASICEGGTYILEDGTVVSDAGVYTFDFMDAITGCITTYQATIEIDDAFRTTQDISICEGQSYILPDGGEQTITGVYESALQSIQGCDSIITINLSIEVAPLIEYEASICEGGTYILEDGTAVNEAGVYIFDLTDAATGCITTYQTTINVDNAIQTNEGITICQGETYILPDGREASIPNLYESTLQSSQGCDSIILTNLNITSIEIDLPTELVLQLDGIKLTNIVRSENPVEYLWSPQESLSCFDCPEPVAIPNETTNYLLEVIDTISGCRANATVQVTINKTQPVVPNAFSPNSDGINDHLIPLNVNPDVDFLFTVYNRWGQKLFETTSTNISWDGSFKNYQQPAGVYIWFFQYQEPDESIKQMHGNVTLVR